MVHFTFIRMTVFLDIISTFRWNTSKGKSNSFINGFYLCWFFQLFCWAFIIAGCSKRCKLKSISTWFFTSYRFISKLVLRKGFSNGASFVGTIVGLSLGTTYDVFILILVSKLFGVALWPLCFLLKSTFF